MSKHLIKRARNNLILIVLNIIYIFILGIFDHYYDMYYVYFTFLSAIILFSIYTISSTDHYLFSIPGLIVISTWVSELLNLEVIAMITGYLSVLFFLFVNLRAIYPCAVELQLP